MSEFTDSTSDGPSIWKVRMRPPRGCVIWIPLEPWRRVRQLADTEIANRTLAFAEYALKHTTASQPNATRQDKGQADIA